MQSVYTGEQGDMADFRMIKHMKPLRVYAVLVVAYILTAAVFPFNSATRAAYNLDLAQARIMTFITILPLLGVWFIAFYCYGALQHYARSIHTAREGAAFKKIANGVTILSWGLVIQAFSSLLLGNFTDVHSGWYAAAIIMQNYIALIFPVAAFSLIAAGTRHLLVGKHNYGSLPASRMLLVLFALLSTVYTYLIIHLGNATGGAAYHLPPFLLLSTIVVPYVYSWFSGVTAAYDISLYARVTHGFLYKRSLNFLSAGLVVLIVSSILLQYLNSLFLSSAHGISINSALLVDYILLIGISLGYGLMIAGVRGLQKIEEI